MLLVGVPEETKGDTQSRSGARRKGRIHLLRRRGIWPRRRTRDDLHRLLDDSRPGCQRTGAVYRSRRPGHPEKKAYEREVARKNTELHGLLGRIREFDETKTQFFANVSHELRTPLALILRPAESLKRADLGAAERAEIADVACTGQEAVDSANRFGPEVALLDIGMPTLNGYQVARRKRGLP
jgi:signal transduction histidine kinase